MIFTASERRFFDIQRVAQPHDISIFNCDWCEGRSYYADFCGLGFKYRPTRVLEIGVRYGYSGLAVCTGAQEAGIEKIHYTGIDAEILCLDSNAAAEAKFREFLPAVTTRFFRCDTLREGLPRKVLKEQFDYILVDGDHSYEGARADLMACWPLLASGGILVIDDLGMVDVQRAVDDHVAALEAAGEPYRFQQHHNERIFAIFQKGKI